MLTTGPACPCPRPMRQGLGPAGGWDEGVMLRALGLEGSLESGAQMQCRWASPWPPRPPHLQSLPPAAPHPLQASAP